MGKCPCIIILIIVESLWNSEPIIQVVIGEARPIAKFCGENGSQTTCEISGIKNPQNLSIIQ